MIKKEKMIQVDYVIRTLENNGVEEFEITNNEYLYMTKAEGTVRAVHIRNNKEVAYETMEKFEDVKSILTTDVEGLVIINNEILYNFKKAKFVTKKYDSLEAIGNRLFFVEDHITVNNHDQETIKKDTLFFQINENNLIVSDIYSTISHDWVAWPAENKAFDYYGFTESRKNFLSQLEEKEVAIIKKLTRINPYYNGESEK